MENQDCGPNVAVSWERLYGKHQATLTTWAVRDGNKKRGLRDGFLEPHREMMRALLNAWDAWRLQNTILHFKLKYQ